ncbi:MAG: GPR1/FUN34/YaaH family transporter [Nocardioides sp.]|uniref:GPR1/FUN34/YaaH family transporter n=1 Tax=Nocardioides sp. TaxID=35761 RepID=UPI0039E6756A
MSTSARSTMSATEVVPAEPAAPPGDPAMIGVPTFLVGSIALGLNLVGYVDQGVVGSPIAIIALATGIGQVIAAVWAASLAQNAVAGIFGIFSGFWLSYAALVFGLLHHWYGLTAEATTPTVKMFLLAWLVLIVLLTLVTLRLPLAFTILFVLIDLALLFVLLAYANAGAAGADSGLLTIGGVLVFCFCAVGAYLFADAAAGATGGPRLPMGRPVLS